MKKVKIKSLPKAQQVGQIKDWRDLLNWNNPTPPTQNLVGDIRKVKTEPAVAESTNANPKLPRHWTNEEGKQRSVSEIRTIEAEWEKARQDQIAAEKEKLRLENEEVKRKKEEYAKENFGVNISQLDNFQKYDDGSWSPKSQNQKELEAGFKELRLNELAQQRIANKKTTGEELEFLAETLPFALIGTGAYSQAFKAFKNLGSARNIASSARVADDLIRPAAFEPYQYEDELFRYLDEAESTSGIDRDYLSGMPDDDYQIHRDYQRLLQNPRFEPNQRDLARWVERDARIRNVVTPPPDELVYNGYNFENIYTNPFNQQNIIESTNSSLIDRLMARLPGFRRTPQEPTIDLRRRPENFVSSFDTPEVLKNRSQFTKEQAKALLKDKSELDKLDELRDQDFRNVLITPDGKLKFAYEQEVGKSEMFPMQADEWVQDFNDNIDLLNDIIGRNNQSGRDYIVTSLEKVNDKKGLLHFRTPEGRTSTMNVGITPGRFRGDVKDIADEYYMTDNIPGLQMEGASPIFGVAVPKTRTYQSLNEFLKTLDMGRIKSGMNIQSDFSRGLWEDAIKKGNAFGYYNSPRVVHGIMKKDGGPKKKDKGFQILTDTNGKYVFVKT
jgi:outer membrane biosynthesis protein TonB